MTQQSPAKEGIVRRVVTRYAKRLTWNPTNLLLIPCADHTSTAASTRQAMTSPFNGFSFAALASRASSSSDPSPAMERANAMDLVSNLPLEIVLLIFQSCDPDALRICSYVSRAWHGLVSDPLLWKALYETRYGRLSPSQLQLARGLDGGAGSNPFYKPCVQSRHVADRRWARGAYKARSVLGHMDSIYCVHFDAKRIVTGSRDRTIKFWTHDGYCQRTLRAHDGSVLCVQFDDTHLVSGSSDHSVFVWCMSTFQVKFHLTGHGAAVLDVALGKQHVVSCSKDSTLKIWMLKDGSLVRTLRGHRGPVNAVQFKCGVLISACGDGSIKRWDMHTGRVLRDYEGHTKGLACIQLDDHARTLVSGGGDHAVRVWDVATGQCRFVCDGHTNLVRALDIHDKYIVSGSYDRTIRVWDIHTGKCIHTFQGYHATWVFDVQFDGRRIISTSQDQRIMIMDFTHGLDWRFFAP